MKEKFLDSYFIFLNLPIKMLLSGARPFALHPHHYRSVRCIYEQVAGVYLALSFCNEEEAWTQNLTYSINNIDDQLDATITVY